MGTTTGAATKKVMSTLRIRREQFDALQDVDSKEWKWILLCLENGARLFLKKSGFTNYSKARCARFNFLMRDEEDKHVAIDSPIFHWDGSQIYQRTESIRFGAPVPDDGIEIFGVFEFETEQ